MEDIVPYVCYYSTELKNVLLLKYTFFDLALQILLWNIDYEAEMYVLPFEIFQIFL